MIEILHRPGFLSALTHISSHYSQLCTSAVHTKKQINLMNIQYLPMRISSWNQIHTNISCPTFRRVCWFSPNGKLEIFRQLQLPLKLNKKLLHYQPLSSYISPPPSFSYSWRSCNLSPTLPCYWNVCIPISTHSMLQTLICVPLLNIPAGSTQRWHSNTLGACSA